MTAWYAGASLTVLLAVVGLLYWALADNLNNEDDQELATKIELLRTLLREQPDDIRALNEVVDSESNSEHPKHHEVYVRIVSASGKVVSQTPGIDEMLSPGAFPSPLPLEASSGPGVNMVSLKHTSLRVLSALAQHGIPPRETLTVQVALDRTPEAALLSDYRRRVWIILGLAVVASSIGGYFAARRGIRPVEQITETTKRIHSTTLDARIPTANLPLEIGRLAEQFNGMLDRLKESFGRLSRFSNDIAHELRTPINNLRGSVEVSLSKERSSDEYREALSSCLEDATRLGRIIESLLFLARSENPQTRITVEPVDLLVELNAVREYYAGLADESRIDVQVTAPEGLKCELDRTLFQRAIGNLLENSISHTSPGGAITLAAKRDNGTVRISVSDTGHGIAPDDLPHVFDRFYKAQTHATHGASNSGGLGLGLAIVRGIATVHGGTVEITSQPDRGTTVTLALPVHFPNK